MACVVVSIILCLAWNDQLELSRNEGLIFSRTIFGREFRKVMVPPEDLERLVVKKSRKLSKIKMGVFEYIGFRNFFRVNIRSKNGRDYALGPWFPRLVNHDTDHSVAQRTAETAGRRAANSLGLPFTGSV